MNFDERAKYVGACALLGRVVRYCDDQELKDCVEQAMRDCAELCEGLEVVRIHRGWSLEPTGVSGNEKQESVCRRDVGKQ